MTPFASQAVGPTLLRMEMNKDEEIKSRMALLCLANNCATNGQFNILLDVADMLLLGSEPKTTARLAGTFGKIALAEISKDRSNLRATEPQVESLRKMLSVAYDFWLKQPNAIFNKAATDVRQLRISQLTGN